MLRHTEYIRFTNAVQSQGKRSIRTMENATRNSGIEPPAKDAAKRTLNDRDGQTCSSVMGSTRFHTLNCVQNGWNLRLKMLRKFDKLLHEARRPGTGVMAATRT